MQQNSSNPNQRPFPTLRSETDTVRCPAIGWRDPRKRGTKRVRLVRLGARIRFDRIDDLPAESRSCGILGELMRPGPMQSVSRLAARGLAETLSARSCRRWRSGPLVREAVVSG